VKPWLKRMLYEAFCDCDHLGACPAGHRMWCRGIQLFYSDKRVMQRPRG
jgi:hypothetical protein